MAYCAIVAKNPFWFLSRVKKNISRNALAIVIDFKFSSPIQPSPSKDSPQTTLFHSSLAIVRVSLRSNSLSYLEHHSRAFIFGDCCLLQQLSRQLTPDRARSS
ncbi:hypothetical protein HOY82DRAFT_552107 [Tuber indicum]|nr:hypothetical protein HOY82DRAFT_552107 [Tuber indicum]